MAKKAKKAKKAKTKPRGGWGKGTPGRAEAVKASAARKTRNVRSETNEAPKRTRTPRSQALPGMEKVRNATLDALCEDIGDARDIISESRRNESEAMTAAQQIMHEKGIATYHNAKIELALVPGAEKLRVRLVKDAGRGQSMQAEDSLESEVEEAAGQEDTEGDVADPELDTLEVDGIH